MASEDPGKDATAWAGAVVVAGGSPDAPLDGFHSRDDRSHARSARAHGRRKNKHPAPAPRPLAAERRKRPPHSRGPPRPHIRPRPPATQSPGSSSPSAPCSRPGLRLGASHRTPTPLSVSCSSAVKYARPSCRCYGVFPHPGPHGLKSECHPPDTGWAEEKVLRPFQT